MSDIVCIEDLSHDGRGVARVDGKIVFVDGALPQEKVRIQYQKKRKDFDEASILEMIEASPERVEPLCKHFGICGGCSLQHLLPEAQIKYKESHWLGLMRKMGGGEPESLLPALQQDIWHYRRKARLGVKYVPKKERVLIGFREKHHSQYLMDMEECPILHADFEKQLPKLKKLLNEFQNPRAIAQIELAVGDDVALVFRNMESLSDEDKNKLDVFASDTGFKIYLQSKGPESLELLYPSHSNFMMQFELPKYHAHIQFHPLDFFQVNALMNLAMIEQALTLLDLKATDEVLDLFCGLGNFTLPIARFVKHVYGIEGSPLMVKRATENARLQAIQNVSFEVANLQDEEVVSAFKQRYFNKVLLDPARDGAEKVVHILGQMAIERIVYVSCHPATLARDAAILRNHYGYRLVSGGVMDMFPHTSHIESMALFIKE